MKQTSGLFLCRPAEKQETGWRTLLHRFLQEMLLLTAIYGLLQSLTGAASPGVTAAFFGTALLLCGLRALLTHGGKETWLTPALLAVLLALSLLLGRNLTEGFCLWWNRACSTWTLRTGRLLLGFAATADPARQTLCSVLFAAVGAGLLSAAVSWLRGRAGKALAALLPVGLLVSACCAGLLLEGGWPVVTAAAAVLLLTLEDRGGRGRELRLLLTVGSCLLVGLVTLGLCQTFDADSGLQDWHRTVRKSLHDWRFETEDTALPEGDFSDYDPEKGEGRTALLVTMEQPEELYLRGFVGDRFRGGVWTPLENQVLEAEKERIYWLWQGNLRTQGQFERAAALLEQTYSTVTVQNVNACSEVLYLPYQVQLASCTALDRQALSVSGAMARGFRGSRDCSYRILTDAAHAAEPLLELLRTEEREEILEYRRLESSLRSFVYDYALEVPNAVREQLGPTLDACCSPYGEADSLTVEEAQRSALAFLEKAMGEERQENPVLPLSETADGTSYQYATVAAMALRYYGIPARYAEGYVISGEMAGRAGPNEKLSLDGSCAGAWVEVYQDGLGWMPMEVTPGFEALAGEQTEAGFRPIGIRGTDENAQIGSEKGNGSGTYISEGEELEDDRDADADERDNERTRDRRKLLVTLAKAGSWLLLLVLVLLLALVLFRRITILRRRKALLQAENPAEALTALFGHTVQLLQAMGLDRGSGSVDALQAAAEQRFGEDYARQLQQASALNREALFSSHSLRQEQLQIVQQLHGETLEHLKQETRPLKRWKLQWIKCLY